MDFRFNEEQEELRAMAQQFLAEHSDSEAVRRAMESDLGWEPALWEQIGAELGWPAVHIPEAYGGLGLTHVELVALLEQMGSTLTCSPFFATVCLGANALLVAGSEAQKSAHLPGIAEGRTRATLAFAGTTGGALADTVDVVARRAGEGWTLEGRHRFVLDGHSADLLVVAAREAGSAGEDGISLFVVEGDTPGLQRSAVPTMDQTRRLAEITFADVKVGADALLGEPGAGWPALETTLQLAAIGQGAEQVGGAQRCLDMSVDYAKERVQFGRPIGSFQAIKHKCADMMVQVESARSAVYYAGCVASDGSEELPACASLVKAYCSDTYFRCAADAIQIHGGVGFTWEYDVHLHFKRAKSTESFLGDPAHHREQVARRIGL